MSVKIFVKRALAGAVLFIWSAAGAQQQMQRRTPQEKAQKQMQWMQANMSLTPDQNQKAYNIFLKYAAEADNARADGQRGARKEIRADKDADLKRILTGDQYQLYQAHEQQMKEKMQQRRGMQHGGY